MNPKIGPFEKDPYPIESITHDIEFIDFSADNNYMVYKEYSGEKTYVEVSGGNVQTHINPNAVETSQIWQCEGLREYNPTIENHYTGSNGIQKLTVIGSKTMVVTDDMGTVSIILLLIILIFLIDPSL